MKKTAGRSVKSGQFVIGRDAFAKISAVEGIRLTQGMKQDFKTFDVQNLSASERRKAILKKYGSVR